MFKVKFVLVYCALAYLFLACSFDYEALTVEEGDFPEITMDKLEYVRVRDSEMNARLKAEYGERYEKKHLMNLKNYQFEQYDPDKKKVDAEGKGGAASMEMESNNVRMTEGIELNVDSEDLSMRTLNLEWEDRKKTLKSDENTPIKLERGDGTEVNGTGFFADIRSRSWVFSSNVDGVYVDEDGPSPSSNAADASNNAGTAEGGAADNASAAPAPASSGTEASAASAAPAASAAAPAADGANTP